MQLSPSHGNIDDAIKELERVIPLCALQNVINERERRHKPRKELRRHLELLKAMELAGV